jgi:hypothetical protein
MGVAIVLIHHAKKTGNAKDGNMDWTEKALGSTGLTGATDSTILIDRNRAKETSYTATLYATGRDTADLKYNLTLDLDCGGWTITDKPAPDHVRGKASGNGKQSAQDENSSNDYTWKKYLDMGSN